MRVLVVDDEPCIVLCMEKHLTRSGFEVETASDGADALAKIQANPPDVLVCDTMMPVMGGYELVSVLEKDQRFNKVKIVLLTGSDADRHRAPFEKIPFSKGIIGLLVKPFYLRELVFAVNNMAGTKQPEDERKNRTGA